MGVQLQKATQYHYWRAVMAIFPLARDQTMGYMICAYMKGKAKTTSVKAY